MILNKGRANMDYKIYKLQDIINELKQGNVVCLKTETVYGVFMCFNENNCYDKIYNIKHRNSSKKLGIYLHTNHEKYKNYYNIFGNLNGLTIVENGQSYRFCNSLNNIIENVGPLIGTSANESGYPPVTNPSHFKLNCPIYNQGRCHFGLESTVFSLDDNKVLRYGLKYIEPLPENLNIKYKVNSNNNKCKISLNYKNDLINGFHLWNYINNDFKLDLQFLTNSYINELIYKTYNSIEFI